MATATMASKRVRLLERVTPTSGRVDREAGVIRGVRIIGRESANGRTYSDNALRDAVPLYEGKRVLINHPSRREPYAERGVQDHFGVLRNVVKRGDGLYADLHFLRSHPLAGQVCEMAENQPNQLGLSHNAEGEMSQKGGRTVVECIVSVRSVDLVLNPATNRGLFESLQKGKAMSENFEALALEVLRSTMSKKAKLQKLATILDMAEELGDTGGDDSALSGAGLPGALDGDGATVESTLESVRDGKSFARAITR